MNVYTSTTSAKKSRVPYVTYSDVDKVVKGILASIKQPKPEKHVCQLGEVHAKLESLSKAMGRLAKNSDVTALKKEMDNAVSDIEVPTDYAKSNHKHSASDLHGKIPTLKIEDGLKLLKQLRARYAPVNHSHPELVAQIKTLEKAVKGIEIPDHTNEFTEIWKSLKVLENAIPKVDNRTVELVVIEEKEVKTPKKGKEIATSKTFYVPLNSLPSGKLYAKDKKGQEGTVSVVNKGNVFVLFASFDDNESYPITFLSHE